MAEQKKYPEYIIKLPSTKERLAQHQEKIESFRKKLDEKRTLVDRIADDISKTFGSISFFFWNAIFFIVWIILNINVINGVVPFDPYPFGLLTMIVSLEAIFLSVFVLISQNRQAQIADLREEIDLQINMIAEKEITKLIHMQAILMKHHGIKIEGDKELEHMMQTIDTQRIQTQLENEEQKPSKQALPFMPTAGVKSINGVIKKITKLLDKPLSIGV